MTFRIMADRRKGPSRPRTQNPNSEPTIRRDGFQWPQFVQQMQQ